MRRLPTKVDTGSAAFAANAEVKRALATELRERSGKAALAIGGRSRPTPDPGGRDRP